MFTEGLTKVAMTCWDTNMNCGVGQNTGIRGTRAQPEHVNRDTRELLPVPSGQSSEQDSDHTRTQANKTQREHLAQGGVTEKDNVDTQVALCSPSKRTANCNCRHAQSPSLRQQHAESHRKATSFSIQGTHSFCLFIAFQGPRCWPSSSRIRTRCSTHHRE